MVGCDDIAKEFGYTPAKAAPPVAKAEPAPANQELTAAEAAKYLTGEMTLEPSRAWSATNDQRPIWIVYAGCARILLRSSNMR
jgi:hypothetical protein